MLVEKQQTYRRYPSISARHLTKFGRICMSKRYFGVVKPMIEGMNDAIIPNSANKSHLGLFVPPPFKTKILMSMIFIYLVRSCSRHEKSNTKMHPSIFCDAHQKHSAVRITIESGQCLLLRQFPFSLLAFSSSRRCSAAWSSALNLRPPLRFGTTITIPDTT